MEDWSGSNDRLEIAVYQGVVASHILINKNLVQFYKSGVVSNEACLEGVPNERIATVIATTGYARNGVNLESLGLGQGVSKPFWQVRWAYGPNYGVYGSMWIEKWSQSSSTYGPCNIHTVNRLFRMKRY